MSSEVACSTAVQRPTNQETRTAERKASGNKNKGMDHVTKTTVGTKKNNKENAKPANSQSVPAANRAATKKETAGSSAALQSKGDRNAEGSSEAGDAPKKDGVKARPAGRGDGAKKRQTLTQAFLSQHAVQQRKLAVEAAKPPAAAPPKYPPGTYRGKAVQSKVNSFRKLAGSDAEAKPTAAQTRPAAPAKEESRSRRVTVWTRPADLAPAAPKPSAAMPLRSKSVSHRARAPTSQQAPATAGPRATGARTRVHSAPSKAASVGAPPARAHPVPGGPTVTSRRKELQQAGKSKTPVVTTARKASKPPATSIVSQYRVPMETAEERKAKLAEWLASKGRTLRRPPIASAPAQTLPAPAAKAWPEAAADPERNAETDPVARQDSNPEPRTDARPREAPELAALSSSDIMNTTLDLLENSEMDLPVDPEIRMDDVVVNLCNALEAMEVPSAYEKDPERRGDDEGRKSEEEKPMEAVEGGDFGKETSGFEEVKVDGETPVPKGMKKEKEEEEKCTIKRTGDGETPLQEAEGASVVRYSVKTTPYLQSVTRRIHGDATPGSGPRRQSAIKDLKFLTPVRRSVRIQREAARLPGMLGDHDPCVSSLAELLRLDSDPNAYVYRRNPALLEEQPEQPGGV